ncbi:unnamed protein product [Spirodela intermedia]|uniref:Uncharacterized protein n=1 Tax=Spirodela intermedia TaxID=51605 RepID=A0A7I8IQ26_SPIIN|nr:unnamed protein product [Spirodela intermedia]CAA6660040.1 unnamed protein product [Spirodela intermedia]
MTFICVDWEGAERLLTGSNVNEMLTSLVATESTEIPNKDLSKETCDHRNSRISNPISMQPLCNGWIVSKIPVQSEMMLTPKMDH